MDDGCWIICSVVLGMCCGGLYASLCVYVRIAIVSCGRVGQELSLLVSLFLLHDAREQSPVRVAAT